MGLFNKNKTKKYSDDWFKQISNDDFYKERETVRQRFIKGDLGAERLLDRFGDEEVDRLNKKYMKEHPNAKYVYHEHGWHLPSDD